MQTYVRKNTDHFGFTLVEFLVAISIMLLVTGGAVGVFNNFRNSQGLHKDTELIVAVVRQARSQTLTSQNASQYGVHISTSKVTLFTGSTYSAVSASNQDFFLTTPDVITTITLTGGGNDIVFQRLSGETSQNGTLVVTSPATANTKTVTIYKTGLIESN